ncbi:MAG: replication initiation factor domain-containing protein [Oscillospiraceae bacterium]|nr:replication initiation factor domain-containing protein [Oscillospiraceae bacterium]
MTSSNIHNNCTIDAFTCSIHGITPGCFIRRVLKLDPSVFIFQNYGRYGYRSSLRYASIEIYVNGGKDMGICLDLKSQGCADLVHLTQNESVFYEILSSKIPDYTSLTRIDVAMDDHCGSLDMDTMADKVEKREVRTRLRSRTQYKSLDDTDGHTIYFGTPKSDVRIRIYDKQAELRTLSHWIRVELVLRRHAAKTFQNQVIQVVPAESKDGNQQIAMLGAGVLWDRLAFVNPTDVNISRCTVCTWWENFLEGLEPLHLAGKDREIPSIQQMNAWLHKQVSGSLSLMVCLMGPAWLEQLICDGAYRIKDEVAQPMVQEMVAHKKPIAIDPCQDYLPDKIRDVMATYYKNKHTTYQQEVYRNEH